MSPIDRPRTLTNCTDQLANLVARDDPWGFVYMEGCEAWSMAEHYEARTARVDPGLAEHLGIADATCPVCKDGELGRKRYCLGCDRTGLDARVEFGGLDVDQLPDEDWAKAREAEKVYIRHAG